MEELQAICMTVFGDPSPLLKTSKVAEAWENGSIELSSFGTSGYEFGSSKRLAELTASAFGDMEMTSHPTGCGCGGCNMRDDSEPGFGRMFMELNSNAPTGTLQDLADFLSEGFWTSNFRNPFSYNLSGNGANANSGELHYNVSGFTNLSGFSDGNGIVEARRELVRDSFDIFEEILGVTFTETASTNTNVVDFFFMDNQNGAFAFSRSDWATGNTSQSFINVNAGWSQGTSTYNDYTLQTILHEIGHALGLGHQGNYNGSGNFGNDAEFSNDSWQATMMSYFSQTENPTIDADYEFLQTPMAVDWVALQDLYGGQSHGGKTFGIQNAFTGDTVYGFNTNIGAGTSRIWHEFASYANRTASTIVDGGGVDTLDFSGYGADQRIDLTPSSAGNTQATASDVGGRDGNLTLAVGTVIENATTGAGDDRIDGNDANNTLIGNAGNDYLRGYDGNDALFGGSGNDELIANWGEDYVEGGAGNDTLRGGRDDDTLIGGDGDDLLTSGMGEDYIDGGRGNDRSGGRDGNDTMIGGEGDDSFFGGDGDDLVQGGADDDTLFGGRGRDTLEGGSGADFLWGRWDNDVLIGGAGNDTLEGDRGEDSLYGERGNDVLIGGGGIDRFYFGAGDEGADIGNDVIADFALGEDKLVLAGNLASGRSSASDFLADFATQSADGLLLSVGAGSVQLSGVTSMNDLADDILFA